MFIRWERQENFLIIALLLFVGAFTFSFWVFEIGTAFWAPVPPPFFINKRAVTIFAFL